MSTKALLIGGIAMACMHNDGCSYIELRTELVRAARHLTELGVLSGMDGNISVRVPNKEQMIISRAGVKSIDLTPENLVIVDFHGGVVEGSGKPSSGVPMHAMAYTVKPDAGAVIHTHSPFATSFAVAGKSIPDALEALRDTAGGGIPVTKEYAKLGTQTLAENVREAMSEAWAVLLRNHGVLAMGRDLQHAVKVAYMVEAAARIVTLAEIHGRVTLLPTKGEKKEAGAV